MRGGELQLFNGISCEYLYPNIPNEVLPLALTNPPIESCRWLTRTMIVSMSHQRCPGRPLSLVNLSKDQPFARMDDPQTQQLFRTN